jgi:hypothetical protein
LERQLDTQGDSLFNQFIGTSPGKWETQRIGKGPKCTATAFALSLKHQKNQSPSGGSQDPGTPSLAGVFIYPACRTKYLCSGTPIPPKLKRPNELSDPVCKVVISFLAGKLQYAIDNIAVIRENIFRETLFSWEHLSVTSLLSLPRPKKDTVDALFFIEQVTLILRYQPLIRHSRVLQSGIQTLSLVRL